MAQGRICANFRAVLAYSKTCHARAIRDFALHQAACTLTSSKRLGDGMTQDLSPSKNKECRWLAACWYKWSQNTTHKKRSKDHVVRAYQGGANPAYTTPGQCVNRPACGSFDSAEAQSIAGRGVDLLMITSGGTVCCVCGQGKLLCISCFFGTCLQTAPCDKHGELGIDSCTECLFADGEMSLCDTVCVNCSLLRLCPSFMSSHDRHCMCCSLQLRLMSQSIQQHT